MLTADKIRSTVEEFLPMGQKELTERLAKGYPIDPAALDNWEYKGISLGIPAFVEKLAWKTFKKVFHRDPKTGHLRGWNVRIQQTGLYGDYLPKEKNGGPFTWGHYRVVSNAGRPCAKPSGQGLLIDYGLGGNAAYDVTTWALRDPLVALEKDSADILLGWSYMQFGGMRISTPSFFLLIRDCPLTHVAQPPRVAVEG
jgi:hypothetical protein